MSNTETKYQSLTEDDSIVTPINVRMKNTDISRNVLETIGKTPLVRINKMCSNIFFFKKIKINKHKNKNKKHKHKIKMKINKNTTQPCWLKPSAQM